MIEPYNTMFSKLPDKSKAEINSLVKLLSQGVTGEGEWQAHNGTIHIFRRVRIGELQELN